MEPSVAVFAPAPLLTITIERRGDAADVHLHPGGQGFWLARMVSSLGVKAVLCASFGGEAGAVVSTLVARDGVTLRFVETEAGNAAYVHDRRSGERTTIAEGRSAPLSRHEVDELYSLTIVEALDARVCILGGPPHEGVVPADMYRRLATDVSRAGKLVIADLSGEALRAALQGGVSVLKVSHETLISDGWCRSDGTAEVVAAMHALRDAGAQRVVVSRAEQPALALSDELVEVSGPRLEPVDARGAGDSMTAGIATALARNADWPDALRLGAAAGALNVTRRGLATGGREEIERLREHISIRAVQDDGDRPAVTSPDELASRARPA